jgi:hypothetical protein
MNADPETATWLLPQIGHNPTLIQDSEFQI